MRLFRKWKVDQSRSAPLKPLGLEIVVHGFAGRSSVQIVPCLSTLLITHPPHSPSPSLFTPITIVFSHRAGRIVAQQLRTFKLPLTSFFASAISNDETKLALDMTHTVI
jgi:hypothetical protein